MTTLVVGAGMAGLVAALRLAEAGRRPVVVARGVGCTQLSGGTIDVLGYAPEPVERPDEALAEFIAAHPGHPYARVGVAGVAESLAWLRNHAFMNGYQGGLESNFRLPTAIGTAKPACLAPATMTAGDVRRGGRFLLVGPQQLRDFYAPMAADNLSALPGITARAVALDLPTDEADLSPLAIARRLDDEVFRKEALRRLTAGATPEPGEVVGFPAVLGMAGTARVMAEIEHTVGVPVFEIPTLPPSVPGIRLNTALNAAVQRAGGSIVLGSSVVGADTVGGRIEAVQVQASGGVRTWPVTDVVLASGGWLSGGLDMDSRGMVRETVLGLPVAGVPGAGVPRFGPGYLGPHALARAGIAVDDRLRPLDADGRVVLHNLHVAGAALAGAEPWREKSGDGISVATGYRAADAVLQGGA